MRAENYYALRINEREVYEKQANPVLYAPCTCREKYFLYPGSLLALYLEEECQGWVRDPESRYTLNYLVLVLIANFKSKNILRYDMEENYYYIATDKKLAFIFRQSYLELHDIRDIIALRYLNLDEKKSIISNTLPPILYCLGETRKLAKALLDEDCYDNLVGKWDHWDLSSYPRHMY